jgi:UDP-2,3-diacylglucosamine pyrophosphatase LpxH
LPDYTQRGLIAEEGMATENPHAGEVPSGGEWRRLNDRPGNPVLCREQTVYAIQGGNGRRVRALFISDTHLGCKYANVDALLRLLHVKSPDYIYLVGDIVDGWRLKKSWHWRPRYTQVLQRLINLAQGGTQLFYTPGNHDEFMRAFAGNLGLLQVADEFVHETATGQYYLVTHGDLFDDIERRAKWLSLIGSLAYDGLCRLDHCVNMIRRWCGLPARQFSAAVKRCVKGAVRFVSQFEQRLVKHARSRGCDGVICGHVHTPTITKYGSITYCNAGDWVESRTAMVEYEDGQIALVSGEQLVPDIRRPQPEELADREGFSGRTASPALSPKTLK